ncbi:precorrin-6A synthase (deacetylating) [Roseospira marina]|uniref:Precorrin-6A synthase [deacetylating] n=1 Tax=Roseospira marina TaxID=140057 RepID=A0A5M6IEK2_9PROT|nr:precorrin-6A synthase (deacetylating) [Roseospira marina]KAA5606189.1 precorrin-6A synthase (deacetylating) [Roseospira marina]MBB4314334.1 precorrin-6A synthase [Roseospira marina]MBB5087494.1 precorrin-6A synthase [Roseospira marina]
MKHILLIGIGPGDPDALTLAAIKGIRRTDVFFFLEKEGDGKDSLIRFRREILAEHAADRAYRVAAGASPKRDRASADYQGAVEDWRRRRTQVIADLIDGNMADGETGAFLLWGDPALYDGTMQNLHDLIAEGRDDITFEVIPGITCVQALTAKHRIPLNRVGEEIVITTGRQIETGDPATVTNSIVMLDSRDAYMRLRDRPDMDIFWGGDVGSPDEVLIAGPLDETADRISETIKAQRARKGWIMDTYVLRRRRAPDASGS